MSKKLLVVILLLVGCTKDEIEPFHHAIDKAILDKMSEYGMVGVSLAVIKDEKLVYVNTYGLASEEPQLAVSDEHLFRLASISKVVTAVTILKLASDGLLSLDQTVFGVNGILNNDFGEPPVESKKDQITIRHLIEHTSGWTNTPYDPVFTANTKTQFDLIEDLVTERALSYTPGSTYFYFNMGYVILGRIIEKVTSDSYEDYVVTNVLNPMGIGQMKIGGNTLVERFPNEVVYYSQINNKELPYTMYLRRMDSAAGWISSATDIARLMVHIDKETNKPDIIPPEILNQFYFKSSTWYHTGYLHGTSCVTARLNETFSIVVLTNSDHSDLFNTVKEAVLETEGWPDIDLF